MIIILFFQFLYFYYYFNNYSYFNQYESDIVVIPSSNTNYIECLITVLNFPIYIRTFFI